jgi:N5-(cytidine 5'-diphosphoramidyl)-L-glutamine hydrolase
MKRIGISQRVELVTSHSERRDCLDQRWAVLLELLGLQIVPIPNHLAEVSTWIDVMALDGFILSGGNDLAHLPGASRVAPERDRTETDVLEYAEYHELPVLGVCRGLQMMNLHLGGRLTPVAGHVATRHSVTPQAEEGLFSSYFDVNSFHDWGIHADGLADSLVAGVHCNDGTVEAAYHRSLPWASVMWHPERETPFVEADLDLIRGIFGVSS